MIDRTDNPTGPSPTAPSPTAPSPTAPSPSPATPSPELDRLRGDIWRRLGAGAGDGVMDFGAWFGNDQPVEIEIGCGKGAFLTAQALAHGDVNYVGVEKEGKYLKKARMKLEKRGVPNVRLIHGDMACLLLNHIRDRSVRAYHIFFPDPWPKRRHGKRRMIRDVTVQQLARTLAPGGELWIKTDLPVNFTRMRRVVEDSGLFEMVFQRCWSAGQAPADNVPTNFETKYAIVGKETFQALWRVRQ